jgi:hypothetical protein
VVVSGGGGAHAPWWPRGPAPTPRRSSSRPRNQVAWPLVRSVESCQTCSRLTIVTSRPPWRRLQHAPRPIWRPKAGGRHTARTRYDPWPLPTGRTPTTPRFYRVSAGVAHPTTTLHHPPWRPTKRRARVSHEGNSSVPFTQSYLGMKRRRTRYRTALGALKHCVSDFWSEGPKRQPTGRWCFFYQR